MFNVSFFLSEVVKPNVLHDAQVLLFYTVVCVCVRAWSVCILFSSTECGHCMYVCALYVCVLYVCVLFYSVDCV